MFVGSERGLDAEQPRPDAEHCLLLIRAPSDRTIYDTFRTLAVRGRGRLTNEHLWIEGDIPLTPGLAAPGTPTTLERLLEADCEMIDRLELQFGGFRIAYIRSGGHSPYRESFFDEIRLEASEHLGIEDREIAALIEVLFEKLSVTSHSGTPFFSDLIARIGSNTQASAEAPYPLGRASQMQA